MNQLDIVIACGVLFVIYIHWYIDRRLGEVRQWIQQDVPLKEMIAVRIGFEREFFFESLKLSDQEIDGSPELVQSLRVRLQIWKGHYSGDITFHGKDGAAVSRCEFLELPTDPHQFPVELGEAPLMKRHPRDDEADFGSKRGERLAVLLSHKSLTSVLVKNGPVAFS